MDLLIIIIGLMIILYLVIINIKDKNAKINFIEEYTFPAYIIENVQTKHDYLSEEDMETVVKGMKEYFILCVMANWETVSMPSKIVDELWHEFLLCSKEYQSFCEKAFGHFLHHTPAEMMEDDSTLKKGMVRAWELAYKRDGIDARNPTESPLLFKIDRILSIKGGISNFLYVDMSPDVSCGGCG